MPMKLIKGTWREPVAGVVDVEFWYEMAHFGKLEEKNWAKKDRTCSLPSVPETRGTSIGARMDCEPVRPNVEAGRGRERSVEEERFKNAVISGAKKMTKIMARRMMYEEVRMKENDDLAIVLNAGAVECYRRMGIIASCKIWGWRLNMMLLSSISLQVCKGVCN